MKYWKLCALKKVVSSKNPKLASLLSSSGSCLRAALIDLDNVLVVRKTSSHHQGSTFPSKFSSSRVFDFRVRHYVHSQQIPRRCFHKFGPLRQSASAALDILQQDNSAAPLIVDTHGARGYNRDNNWFEPDDPETPENAHTHTPVITSHFDWRKFKSSRVAFPLSTPTSRKRYPLRKITNFSPTEPGDPYHDVIQRYSEQYVDLI